MNFRSIAIIALSLAPISFSITFFQKPALAIPSGYCIHGNVWTREDIGRVKATVLLQGDFDGDGKIDYFCKDIRQKDPNGKQALEWLILGNGNSPIVAQPNNWCTHKNSRLSVVRKGDRDKLLCSDINTSWLRSLPSAQIDDAPAIYGEVVLTLPNPESTQCKDLKVNLVSKEILPKPNDGGIHLDVPIFKYSQPLSGDLKTGKCNYIIGATLGDIGKKAYLTFSSGGSMSGGQPSNSLITVPRGLMKMNFETAFFYIN